MSSAAARQTTFGQGKVGTQRKPINILKGADLTIGYELRKTFEKCHPSENYAFTFVDKCPEYEIFLVKQKYLWKVFTHSCKRLPLLICVILKVRLSCLPNHTHEM